MISLLVWQQRITIFTPLAEPDPFNLVCFLGGGRSMCVSHSVVIIQMFQTPALIVISIAATRMHRSLTDFADSGYNASCLPCSRLILTATNVAVLRLSFPARFWGGARRKKMPNGSSHRQFRRIEWKWPCKSRPRTARLLTWANVAKNLVLIAWIASRKTDLSFWAPATTLRTVSRKNEPQKSMLWYFVDYYPWCFCSSTYSLLALIVLSNVDYISSWFWVILYYRARWQPWSVSQLAQKHVHDHSPFSLRTIL